MAEQRERVLSTDELTAVQARARAQPDLPLAPGQVERRACASIGHGTTSFMLNRDVVSGPVVAPSCGPTRTATDFRDHIPQTVATAPDVRRWPFVVDTLNIPCATALGRSGAAHADSTADRGVPSTRGLLRHRQTRAALLREPGHRLVFPDTPQHASWMNQSEIGLRILTRKLLRRGNFTAVDDLKAPVLAFIDDDNRTMAKPFKWTYQGKALAA